MRYYNEEKRIYKTYAFVAVATYSIMLVSLSLLVDFSFESEMPKQIPQEGILISVGDISDGLAPELNTDLKKAKPVVEEVFDDEGIIEPLPVKAVNKKALYKANNKDKSGSSGKSAFEKSKGVKYNNTITTNLDKDGYSLSGRNVVGHLTTPEYLSDGQGRVVIDIQVNQDGKVIHASYQADSSTTNDTSLVEESLKAARSTVFNVDRRAEFIQIGTITYIFKVN